MNVPVKRGKGDADGFRAAPGDADSAGAAKAVASGLGNARDLLNKVKSGEASYHFIEIMGCPGGCVNGGGQPYSYNDTSIKAKRAAGLYKEDSELPVRKSHENPDITRIYERYLGKPLSEVSHHLLHTHYHEKPRF